VEPESPVIISLIDALTFHEKKVDTLTPYMFGLDVIFIYLLRDFTFLCSSHSQTYWLPKAEIDFMYSIS
jgi:hypothetical protein